MGSDETEMVYSKKEEILILRQCPSFPVKHDCVGGGHHFGVFLYLDCKRCNSRLHQEYVGFYNHPKVKHQTVTPPPNELTLQRLDHSAEKLFEIYREGDKRLV